MKILVVFLWVVMATMAKAAPLKLAMTVSDSNGSFFMANLVFDGDTVLEYGPDLSGNPVAEFDLASNSWSESESGARITLAQAREWAEESRTRARSSMERMAHAGQRTFMEELISPSFVTSRSAGGIHLKSRFLRYTASEPLEVDAIIRERFFAFDVLNAYRKAMVLRQTPPFTQLAVARILREEAIMPGLLVTDITTPNGSVRVTTRYRVSALTPEEKAKIMKPGQLNHPADSFGR